MHHILSGWWTNGTDGRWAYWPIQSWKSWRIHHVGACWGILVLFFFSFFPFLLFRSIPWSILILVSTLSNFIPCHIGRERNDWSKCKYNVQRKYSWRSTQKKTRHQQGKRAVELAAQSIIKRWAASYGVRFPESDSESGWRQSTLIKVWAETVYSVQKELFICLVN